MVGEKALEHTIRQTQIVVRLTVHRRIQKILTRGAKIIQGHHNALDGAPSSHRGGGMAPLAPPVYLPMDRCVGLYYWQTHRDVRLYLVVHNAAQ